MHTLATQIAYRPTKDPILKENGWDRKTKPARKHMCRISATTVVCDSETCRWQITYGSERPSVYPIELLHRAYGL